VRRPTRAIVGNLVGIGYPVLVSDTSAAATMALSDMKRRNVRPTANLQKLSDGGGLQLWVKPSGARLWRVAYRFRGKQKLLALGVHPAVSLANARQARDEANRQSPLFSPPQSFVNRLSSASFQGDECLARDCGCMPRRISSRADSREISFHALQDDDAV
jgi:hypothetical protein